MYKSVYHCLGDGRQKIYKIINDEEAACISSVIEHMRKYMSIIDYFLMVLDNCNEFLLDCKHNGPGNTDGFIRVNRLLLNAVNSYYDLYG